MRVYVRVYVAVYVTTYVTSPDLLKKVAASLANTLPDLVVSSVLK